MANLYSNIMGLCNERGVTGYRMCKDAGIQPSILTDLKMGRQKGLSAVNAEKVASYFGISVGELLNADKQPAISNVRDSVVLQGNKGNNVVSNGGSASAGLTEQEQELLRIFRGLDMRKKTAFLSYGYELEDGK